MPGKHPETAKKNIQFQLFYLNNDDYEQYFIFPKINGTDYYAIKNKAGFIVDVAGKKELSAKEKIEEKAGKNFKMKKDSGVEIQTWTPDAKGVPQWQQWRLVIVDSVTVMFESVYSEKAITSKDGPDVQSKLIQYKRDNSSKQKFSLVYANGPKKGQLLNFEK